MSNIAVLIPCYNEELTIGKVVKDFKEALPEAKIYVYNNNSKDNTAKIATEAGAIVRNEYKQGKGNVIRTMFREVEADAYLMVDGDDTYPAERAKQLLAPILEKKADMVIGDRLSNGSYTKENKRGFHDVGNRLVRGSVNRIFKAKLKDIMTGYRSFSRDFIKNIPVISSGFEIETEMTFHALDRNYRILEVPIEYRDRPKGSFSKLNTYVDGYRVIMTILHMFKNYRPLLFFSFIATIIGFIALILGIPLFVEYYQTGMVTRFPTGILATGIAICSLLCFSIGIILDTIVRQHKETIEIMRTINKYSGGDYDKE